MSQVDYDRINHWNGVATPNPQADERLRPQGDGGDAIDFALGHLEKSNVVRFLEDWREDKALEWSGYAEWLECQYRERSGRPARITADRARALTSGSTSQPQPAKDER